MRAKAIPSKSVMASTASHSAVSRPGALGCTNLKIHSILTKMKQLSLEILIRMLVTRLWMKTMTLGLKNSDPMHLQMDYSITSPESLKYLAQLYHENLHHHLMRLR